MIDLVLREENIFVQGQMVHVDFYPDNLGYRDAVMHGADLPIVTSVEDAIEAYRQTAHAEILKYLKANFEGF